MGLSDKILRFMENLTKGRPDGRPLVIFRSKLDNVPENHYICDEDGEWPVDYNYAQLGMDEGWLRYVGPFRHNGIIRHRYLFL